MGMIKEIITVLLAVLPICAILGVLLAFFSYKFGVKENKNTKKIRECLPSINCGACGYKGCDDYASAIAEGQAAPNLCVPGAETTANKIGEILGVEVPEPTDVVAFVACNGNCEATAKKANYDGIMTCEAAAMTYGGPDACTFGCIGLGDCAAKCPADAICIKDGIAHVDTSRCLGCALCASVCPKKVIKMVPQETRAVVMCNNKDKGADARKVCKNACIACKKCEKSCPMGAISVKDNLATIDYGKCKGCGVCAEVCPTGCLKKVYFPDLGEQYSAL